MSQSSKSHGRTRVRWRKQVAKIVSRSELRVNRIASLVSVAPPDDSTAPLHFDVHAARTLALEMIAMATEQTVFEDWTRGRGMGPENREPGAFHECSVECVSCDGEGFAQRCECGQPLWLPSRAGDCMFPGPELRSAQLRGESAPHACYRCHLPWRKCDECALGSKPAHGGWPGNLARKYADERVKYLMARCTCAPFKLGPCSECDVYYQRLRQAPMGRSIARVGQRLLDTLDGRCSWAPSAEPQPGKCQTCGGWGKPSSASATKLRKERERGRVHPAIVAALGPCGDCRGTGHNLRGFIPEVEWPAVTRRKVADATAQLDHVEAWEGECWVDTLAREMPFGWGVLWQAMPGTRGPELHAAWRVVRVVPRGEHRWQGARDEPKTLDQRINARGWRALGSRAHPGPDFRVSRLPRWRRGELRHIRYGQHQARRIRRIASQVRRDDRTALDDETERRADAAGWNEPERVNIPLLLANVEESAS